MRDSLSSFSNFMDENLFMIRATVSTLLGVSLFLRIRNSPNGSRQTPSSLKFYNKPLRGRFLVQERWLKFYHEPVLIRIIRGRTIADKIDPKNCFRMRFIGNIELAAWHNKFGTLSIHRLEGNEVIGVARAKLRWFHIRKSLLSN